jgi:Domain of unknown function (DUF6468)
MLGPNLGMLVESSVAVLLAVTIGYCVILNQRLKRLHQDRGALGKMVGDLMQATGLANAAVMELKTAALEADTQLNQRLSEAERFSIEFAQHINSGSLLMEKIARITAAAKATPLPEAKPEAKQAVEPQGRLQSALQQLATRPGIGGKAA